MFLGYANSEIDGSDVNELNTIKSPKNGGIQIQIPKVKYNQNYNQNQFTQYSSSSNQIHHSNHYLKVSLNQFVIKFVISCRNSV